MRWQSVVHSGFNNDSSPQPKTQQHPLGVHRPRFGLRRAPGIEGALETRSQPSARSWWTTNWLAHVRPENPFSTTDEQNPRRHGPVALSPKR